MEINIADGVDIDAQQVMTGRCCIIGQSGSGKSFLVGVIAEELGKLGLPFVVVDTEGEYRSLTSLFKAIWISNEPGADLGLDADYGAVVGSSIEFGVPIIFDVSDAVDKAGAVNSLLSALYGAEESLRKPYLVIIEEADMFVPQVIHKGGNIIEEISVRGRKRGIGLLVATQRPANISKNVLSQCSYGFIGKLTIENDISAIDILFDSRKEAERIVGLGPGEFLPFGIGHAGPIKVKARSAQHIGVTPGVSMSQGQIDLARIIGSIRSRAADVAGGGKAKEAGGSVSVYVFERKHGIDEARAFAERKAAKGIGIFKHYSVDAVDEVYLPLAKVRILVPTRKKTVYRERYAFIDGNGIAAVVGKRLRIYDLGGKTRGTARKDDDKLLYALRAYGKLTPEKASRLSGIEEVKAARELDRLEGRGLVVSSKGRYRIRDSLGLASASMPSMESVDVSRGTVVAKARLDRVSEAAASAFPGCKLYFEGTVHLPMYRIVLRKGGNVKLYLLDAVSFADFAAMLGHRVQVG